MNLLRMIEVRQSYFRTQFQRFSCENMSYQNGIGPTRAFTSLQMNTVSQPYTFNLFIFLSNFCFSLNTFVRRTCRLTQIPFSTEKLSNSVLPGTINRVQHKLLFKHILYINIYDFLFATLLNRFIQLGKAVQSQHISRKITDQNYGKRVMFNSKTINLIRPLFTASWRDTS